MSDNPGRFHIGGLSIRSGRGVAIGDEGAAAAAITILAMPLIRRYGYGLGRVVPG